MKTLFDIGQEKEGADERSLLLEIGKDYCCTAILHKPSATIDRIRVTEFDEFGIDHYLQAIIHPWRKQSFLEVVVSSAFPQALLFPIKYFKDYHSALRLIYDQPAQSYFHDHIQEWQIVNTYSLPQSICQVVESAFPKVQYFHTYTPAIKIYNGYVADNQLSVHITATHFRVLLKKDMAIHLAQTYSYKTPLDVIYYLLKICYEFSLSQQEVHLILSGLVEKESNLISDLQQYFSHLHFAHPPELRLPESSLPHYYFSSLYNLAACVL